MFTYFSKSQTIVALNLIILLVIAGAIWFGRSNSEEILVDDDPAEVSAEDRNFAKLDFASDLVDISNHAYGDSIVGLSTDRSELYYVDPDAFSISGSVQLLWPDQTEIAPSYVALNPSFANEMYVVSRDGELMMIATDTYQVQKELNVGAGVIQMGVDTENSQLFIINDHGRSFDVIDLALFSLKKKIDLPFSADSMAIDRSSEFVYVAGQNVGSVLVLSAKNLSVVGSIILTGYPSAMVVDPIRDQLLIALKDSGELAVINQRNNVLVKKISVISDPIDIVLGPNNQYAYVLSSTTSGIAVVDLAGMNLVETIKLGSGFDQEERFTRIVLDDEGTKAFVLDEVNDQILSVEL